MVLDFLEKPEVDKLAGQGRPAYTSDHHPGIPRRQDPRCRNSRSWPGDSSSFAVRCRRQVPFYVFSASPCRAQIASQVRRLSLAAAIELPLRSSRRRRKPSSWCCLPAGTLARLFQPPSPSVRPLWLKRRPLRTDRSTFRPISHLRSNPAERATADGSTRARVFPCRNASRPSTEAAW